MFLDFYTINKTCSNSKCPFAFAILARAQSGHRRYHQRYLVSYHVNGQLFFGHKMCHKPYHSVKTLFFFVYFSSNIRLVFHSTSYQVQLWTYSGNQTHKCTLIRGETSVLLQKYSRVIHWLSPSINLAFVPKVLGGSCGSCQSIML